MTDQYLSPTHLLDFEAEPIQRLIADRDWMMLSQTDRVGAAYEFVRNEILFGYNSDDVLPASYVLADGYGQCNTKGTLLMALLRALEVPCRFHGFTIDKRLQRGVVPELVYPIAPANIIHSWVEIHHKERWLNLEGYILDAPLLAALQKAFPDRQSLCAYGAGTNCLQSPDVEWCGVSTYIQKTGINHDYGIFDNPDAFYASHRQLTGVKGLLYRFVIRHWMNHRVRKMRDGDVPEIPGGEVSLAPSNSNLQMQEVI
ncbi:MAG: transglutaminase-like domain-containing protein [Pikeienuella sp.]